MEVAKTYMQNHGYLYSNGLSRGLLKYDSYTGQVGLALCDECDNPCCADYLSANKVGTCSGIQEGCDSTHILSIDTKCEAHLVFHFLEQTDVVWWLTVCEFHLIFCLRWII